MIHSCTWLVNRIYEMASQSSYYVEIILMIVFSGVYV